LGNRKTTEKWHKSDNNFLWIIKRKTHAYSLRIFRHHFQAIKYTRYPVQLLNISN